MALGLVTAGLSTHCGGQVSSDRHDAGAACIRQDGVAIMDGESTACACAVGMGTQQCNQGTLTTCSCTAANSICGNSFVEGDELCDGFRLQGETCASVTMNSLRSGTLFCSATCTFDTTRCYSDGTGGGTGSGGGTGAGGGTAAGGGFGI